MGNLIVDRVKSREIQQIRYSPRQSWRARNSASLRTQSIPVQKSSCSFLKTHRNSRFKSFRPMKPGTPAISPPRPLLTTPCNHAAFLFKTLHSVQLPIGCRGPRPAWAAGSFALHPDLHKKRIQGSSAGGG